MHIDENINKQLKEALSALEGKVELMVAPGPHPDRASLMALLESVAEASLKVVVEAPVSTDREAAAMPSVTLYHDGRPTGITFSGIPGGHEFSSLILAILGADGKAKRPDEAVLRRIRAIKGPVRLKTYVSLSCEICPDIVQALNQMALVHDDFQHEMVDGAYAAEDIQRLGIQGVPSIVRDGKIIHSGKIGLLDLIAKLENTFGIDASRPPALVEKELGSFDVVVVGGGPAGASAAIYSARKGLKTALLAEKIGGQVQETKGIENLISVPYTEGQRLAGQMLEHVRQYPVDVFEHRRVKRILGEQVKTLELESGERLMASTVIVATGAKWRELGVPGEKEYIGRGVAFCPHCDGPYYKGKKVAVIGGGNSGVEAAIDLAGIVREVVVLEFADAFKADHILLDKLKALPNASMLSSVRTREILGDGSKVIGIQYENRLTQEVQTLALDGVFVQIGLLPNSQFLKDTVALTPFGEVVVDEKGRTSLPGVYAAGDVTTTPYKQIVIAMGDGAKVALAAFEDRIKKAA